ncbi:MAG TPA: 2-hydroxychromene-2-carboxylate isomerase [Casimicrobiaceae bacterium]|jgi:2-hydroxychromene-2-carboxylate isomerase
MNAAIEFYFDFSSPYGYLASHKVDQLAAKHGRTVDWRPMLLGAVFKQTGGAPLTMIPLKGDYSKRDFLRSARYHGIDDFRMPSPFPIPTQAAARIMLWTKANDPALGIRIAKALYRGYFFDGRDISNADTAADIAALAGADRAGARASVDDPAMKEALKREVDGAIARGVFGSPFIFVDGEPFWGLDRFDQIDRWLAAGGF